MLTVRVSVALVAAGLFAQTPGAQSPPDTIYYNGHIVTMWSDHPEVEAVAIRGDRFVAVGSNADVRKLASLLDAPDRPGGRNVLPGLQDSHTHPIAAALSEQDRPVPVMNSIPDILAHIRNLSDVTPPDRVIFVPKVYATRLAERRYPDRYELDKAAPRHAAMTDNGYASVLNSAALETAGDRARHTAAAERQDHQGQQGRAHRTDSRRATASRQRCAARSQ